MLDRPDLIDRLKHRIQWLEGLLISQELFFPDEWQLCRIERAVVGALLSRRFCSKSFLVDRAWLGEVEAWNERACQNMEGTISKLRTKLRPFGIEIRVNRGVGYYLHPSRGKIITEWTLR